MNQNQDQEHLRLLTIFHYVVAGMAGLFSLFPLIHLAMGLFIIFGHFKGDHGQPPPAFVGWLLVIIACLIILCGLTMSVLILMTGRCLAKRTKYKFVQVMAGVECLFMPFGTVLGAFTLIVLSRETVRPLFGISPEPSAQHRI